MLRSEAARVGPACLRDHGGDGRAVVLVPSLINPPGILDLDAEVSLAGTIADAGRRALLLDWGKAAERRDLDVAGHVEQLLLPLLRALGDPPAVVGYCLGGTMAIAAANLVRLERVATLAAPWRFSRYSPESRSSLETMWRNTRTTAQALGMLPMEILQAAFWSLDPERTVGKFARLANLDPQSADARRFAALEDWANEGEPLPYPAARELLEDLFGRDLPGRGEWRVGGRPVAAGIDVPALHFTASRDRITPADAAPEGEHHGIEAGHVGMIVGKARAELHLALLGFLTHLAGHRPRG